MDNDSLHELAVVLLDARVSLRRALQSLVGGPGTPYHDAGHMRLRRLCVLAAELLPPAMRHWLEQTELSWLKEPPAAADAAVTHWGMPLPATTICRTDGPRCTTLRMVTCVYCRNRIDRFLSDHHEAFIAANEAVDR